MSWFDDVIKALPETDVQVVNDSKTPSGPAHIGSLRGVLIHSAIYSILKEKNIAVRYTFGVDDYDPLDETPFGLEDYYKEYLGMPLCNVPAPPWSEYKDMASHYIKGFFEIFDELGVEADKYYLRDIYRSGEFNEVIDIILKNVNKVRDIYLKVSNSVKSPDWHPFQVICENCGKIGTTEVVAYDGKEVVYQCKPDLVTWAAGCGNKGKVSPFNGKGKLPWKLEWTAKWAVRGVTIEGAGKDHNSKGGSRDIAVNCLKQIFNKRPPVNIPYGFFKLDGAKMSSSKGIGVTARSMADFLPPKILRYLLIGTQPKRELNFSPSNSYITQLVNGFDRLHSEYYKDSLSDYDKHVYRLSEILHNEDYFTPNYPLITTLIQLRHINIYDTMEARKGSPLTETEKKVLDERISSARHWLDNYATVQEKFELQKSLPAGALDLNVLQRGFLNNLANILKRCEWDENSLQTAIFDASRITPIKQKEGFLAFYTALLDKDAGPKAGNLLCCLDLEFVVNRFLELKFDMLEYWQKTGIEMEEFESWIDLNYKEVIKVDARPNFIKKDIHDKLTGMHTVSGLGVIDFLFTMSDSKTYMKRALLCVVEKPQDETQDFNVHAMSFIESLRGRYALSITISQGN